MVQQTQRIPAPPSLRDGVDSALYDRRRIAVGMLATLALAIAAAALKTPAYPAHTSLLVLMSSEYASRPDPLSTQATSTMAMERDSIMSSEINILISRDLARTVVSEIGVARLYPGLATGGGALTRLSRSLFGSTPVDPEELAVDRFMRELTAVADKSGSTITVTFNHPDRHIAAQALNRLVAAYQRKRTTIYSNAQSTLIKTEVDKSGATLQRIAGELAKFQSQQGISDFGTQMDLLLRRQSELQRSQQGVDTTLAESSQRVATIAAQLQGTARQVLEYSDSESDRRAQAARDSLAQLLQQETELRQTYTDKSRKMVAIREQIAAMRGEVTRAASSDMPSAVRSGANPVATSLQLDLMHARSELSAARESKRELQSQTAALQDQVKTLEDKRTALETLLRQKQLAEQTYLTGTRALGERQIAEDIDSKKAANVRVIEPAEAPLQKSRTRLVILAGGAGLALLVGITIAVLCNRFRGSFISAGRIERELGIPVLATVSRNERLQPLRPRARGEPVVIAELAPAAP